jgi:hypothetical protein
VVPLLHRADVITLVEGVEVEVVTGTALPQSDVVAVSRVAPRDRDVVRQSLHDVAAYPGEGGGAVLVLNCLHAAVESDGVHNVQPVAEVWGVRCEVWGATCYVWRVRWKDGSATL